MTITYKITRAELKSKDYKKARTVKKGTVPAKRNIDYICLVLRSLATRA